MSSLTRLKLKYNYGVGKMKISIIAAVLDNKRV